MLLSATPETQQEQGGTKQEQSWKKYLLDNTMLKLQDLVMLFYVIANLSNRYPYQQITALFHHHCIIIQKCKIILAYNHSIHQVK